jgi:hypothetical protein
VFAFRDLAFESRISDPRAARGEIEVGFMQSRKVAAAPCRACEQVGPIVAGSLQYLMLEFTGFVAQRVTFGVTTAS